MDLARVFVPSVGQNAVASFGLDDSGIMNSLPRQLGEAFTGDKSTAFLGAETILLAVGCIPNPVHEEIGCEEGDEDVGGQGIG